jgi:hypothetical protein
MEPIDLFLEEIKGHPAFPELMKRINTARPPIPEFEPNNDNVEEWKHQSGMKKGFNLCLAILNIRS